MPDSALPPVQFVGTGSYLPEQMLTNGDLEKMVETSDEWITARTGIKERRLAAENQATSDLATQAALAALDDAGLTAEDLDLILLATISADMFFPSTACLVQKNLGATRAFAFDLSAACSGFLYGVDLAKRYLETGGAQTVMVIGAEKLSSQVNWEDRNTCVLFGDGAGAAILQRGDESTGRVLSTVMGSDGRQADILKVPAGGSALPITPQVAEQKLNTIYMAGREVYKLAVTAMRDAALEAIQAAGLTAEDIAMVIPHQANLRIIEAINDRLGIPKERCFVNLEKYGNTSAAAIAIALDEAAKSGAIQRGDKVCLVVFGAGLTWAASVVEW
ncbi:MAG: beta-ketoacyl-ACP synthase III [Verrucomicrobiota bacterium]